MLQTDTTGKAGRSKPIPRPEEEALAGCYIVSSKYCFPAMGIRKSMITASSGMKINKKAARYSLAHIMVGSDPKSMISEIAGDAMCFIFSEPGKHTKEYVIDTRRAVIPKNGSAVVRSRPKFWPWIIDVVFTYDSDIITNEDVITQILGEAGHKIGIGDFRLEKGGWFGAFDVNKIAKQNLK